MASLCLLQTMNIQFPWLLLFVVAPESVLLGSSSSCIISCDFVFVLHFTTGIISSIISSQRKDLHAWRLHSATLSTASEHTPNSISKRVYWSSQRTLKPEALCHLNQHFVLYCRILRHSLCVREREKVSGEEKKYTTTCGGLQEMMRTQWSKCVWTSSRMSERMSACMWEKGLKAIARDGKGTRFI